MSTFLNLFHCYSSLKIKGSNYKGLYMFALLLFATSQTAFAGRIFFDDFESGSLRVGAKQDNGFFWRSGREATISTEKARNGNRSLKFRFKAKPDGKDSFSEQPFHLGKKYTDLWIRYDLFVPANYVHREQSSSTNNKFLYLWSGKYSANFDGPALSIQNWETGAGDSRAVPKAKGPPKSGGGYQFDKHYHKDGGTIFSAADRGKWVTIVVHAKYATSSNNNGVFQLWKIRDGKKITIFNKTNGNWYVPGQSGFDKGYLLGWANSGFTQETVFYMDNIEFSTSPLLDGLTFAPKAPASFQVQN